MQTIHFYCINNLELPTSSSLKLLLIIWPRKKACAYDSAPENECSSALTRTLSPYAACIMLSLSPSANNTHTTHVAPAQVRAHPHRQGSTVLALNYHWVESTPFSVCGCVLSWPSDEINWSTNELFQIGSLHYNDTVNNIEVTKHAALCGKKKRLSIKAWGNQEYVHSHRLGIFSRHTQLLIDLLTDAVELEKKVFYRHAGSFVWLRHIVAIC